VARLVAEKAGGNNVGRAVASALRLGNEMLCGALQQPSLSLGYGVLRRELGGVSFPDTTVAVEATACLTEKCIAPMQR
jgi:hypothetical protein